MTPRALIFEDDAALVSGEWTPEKLRQARRLGCRAFDKPVPPRLLAAWLSEIDGDLITP